MIVYYGDWPRYADLYLKSCRANPNIDFLLFTDLKLEIDSVLEKNVIVHKISFEDVVRTLRNRLGINASSDDPYKLCDLRPAYGLIFQEYLSDYEYWGWSDVDVVLGRTGPFLEDLDGYDVWCVREKWTTGSWTLLRNDEKINTLFKRSPDWKMIFQSSQSWAFDECGGVWDQLTRGVAIENTSSPIVSFTHIVQQAKKEGIIKCHFKDIAFEGVPRLLTYDGRIVDIHGDEYFLFHFITAKSGWTFIYPSWHGIVPEKYYINRFGFFATPPMKGDIVRLIFSNNGLDQIKDKFVKRMKKTSELLRKGDFAYLLRDLKRRMRVFFNATIR